MNRKTRNLSISEYFHVVQKEYLVTEFRRKISYNPKDKAYFQKVLNYKREKINDIAKRNCLLSIFSSSKKLEEIRNELFDKFGRPKFELSEIDLKNYYAVGNEFSYRGEVWILDQITDDGMLTLYSPRLQQYENVSKDEVCRIL